MEDVTYQNRLGISRYGGELIMAEIGAKKRPVIVRRQTEWSPKNKQKAKVKEIVKTVWSGMKIIGGKISEKVNDPKFQKGMGDFARRAGSPSRDMMGMENPKPRKRKHKRKAKKT